MEDITAVVDAKEERGLRDTESNFSRLDMLIWLGAKKSNELADIYSAHKLAFC